ncbi:DUF2861 family protein [Vibrio hangzhouensis]|uniref:DUF2861 family protein n=1 Tax=Vibrio hangzhouensis TaxID=462991 RepID=UPI001C9531BF|nr:DUF2861 family protein [Vibrio hangzhouensis]MBY6196459.1 DUF2861 family protein [Vibrio hangzhouensis]
MSKASKIFALALLSASTSVGADWFENNTTITQAHRHLLNSDLESMFQSLVEEWQQQPSRSINTHINRLFLQSLEVDCGKSYSSKPLPDWLKSVVIRQQSIQSPGRDTYLSSIELDSQRVISDISLKKWVDRRVSSDNEFYVNSLGDTVTKEATYGIRYNLTSPLAVGLYRLDVQLQDGEKWSQWLIFTDNALKQTVRWASKDKWKIEKNALLNQYCPLPKLEVGLYDYIRGKYTQVWAKEYESDYPTSLETENIPPERYVLAVSMKQSRWQGPILFERAQIISKTFDVSDDD